MATGLGLALAMPTLAQELKVWELSSTSEGVNQNWENVIAQFEAEHPGVNVKFETFDGESYKKKAWPLLWHQTTVLMCSSTGVQKTPSHWHVMAWPLT